MRNYTLLSQAKFNKAGENAELVSIPHTWNNLDGQDGGDNYHRGMCTYQFELPNPTPGKRQYIEFRGANHVATVFCNGVELGTHKGGFSTFRFELTEYLNEKNNSMTVNVTNEVCDVYPQRADFTFFGGIYRNVYFVEVENAHFDLMKHGTDAVFVTPSASGLTRIDAFPVCAEGCKVVIELFDQENNLIEKTEMDAQDHCIAELIVSKPHLWQGISDPYCYHAKASLVLDDAVLDEITVTYGYRSYHIDPSNGFYLNGVSTPLRGVCRHQDRENMGWAISQKEHKEDIELIREVGANTIRLAHYQHDQYFYDLCDQIGFCVWAEIPYISRHLESKDAYDNTMSQMTELIAQNYNHPSIIVWGIGNEITIFGTCEEQHLNLRDLHALCKRLDPSRLTTMAQLSSVPITSTHNTITDVVSYNIYYGWYTGCIEDNAKIMDEFHAAFPDKAYGLSEYGVDNLIRWHSATPMNHDYTEEYACLYHHSMLKDFATRPYLWATHMWNMFDFAVDRRAEGGMVGRNCKGLITYDRKIKKDSFFIYKAFWSKTPMVHISGRRFEDRAPGERDVSVYTNCDSVTLFLNGEKYQTKEAVDHLVLFEDVPLKSGKNELKATTDFCEDIINLNGVSEHNTSYDLPDIAAAIQSGNWFSQETVDENVDYGEDGYSCNDVLGTLCGDEDCLRTLIGWVMSNPRMNMGEKLTVSARLPGWRTTAPSVRTPRESKTLSKYFVEEDYQLLDKRLRAIKRK